MLTCERPDTVAPSAATAQRTNQIPIDCWATADDNRVLSLTHSGL